MSDEHCDRLNEQELAEEMYKIRVHFSEQLHGYGLEIGALHRPMHRHPDMIIDYVDKYDVTDLQKKYRELSDFKLVPPTFLDDGEILKSVRNWKYDFVIAAHIIEHVTNPVRALKTWCRIVKPYGLIYLVVPDKRFTFDSKRPCTELSHLIKDYKNPSTERDFEHYLEYATIVDEKHGEAAIQSAKRRIDQDYSIHFHVFDPTSTNKLLHWFSKKIHKIKIVDCSSEDNKFEEFHFLLQVVPSAFEQMCYRLDCIFRPIGRKIKNTIRNIS